MQAMGKCFFLALEQSGLFQRIEIPLRRGFCLVDLRNRLRTNNLQK